MAHTPVPTGASQAILTVQKTATGGLKQILYSNNDSCWERIKYANEWWPWVRLDNFGCNTASDLASLLGGIPYYSFPSSQDVSTINTSGIYGSNPGGTPYTNNKSAIVIHIKWESANFVQVVFPVDGSAAPKWRVKSGNVTSNWIDL